MFQKAINELNNIDEAKIAGFFLGILGIVTHFELGKIDGIFQCAASSL